MNTRNGVTSSLISGLLVGAVFGTMVVASVALAALWADTHCTFSGGNWDIATYKKSVAVAFAEVAVGEGYHYGGGCWNNDNTDNQPGDDTEIESLHGEGPDCSGFVFKTWALRNEEWANGKRHWERDRYWHGPYTASEFKSPSSAPILDKGKANTIYMDAFASSGHVGMIYTANISQGQDRIVEAKGEAYGTNKWIRNYRNDSAYEGAERSGWTPECYPQCV